MGMKRRMKKLSRSMKWSFIFYIPFGVIVAYGGSYVIGIICNYLQDFQNYNAWDTGWEEIIFWFIYYGQLVLIPLWVLFALFMTGAFFYKRELEEPIQALADATSKIADNRLDFSVAYHKKNELGMLCQSFEKMRSTLYQNNQEMWRTLEERKSVNAAFSHDMRTPITVLKGYRDLLEKYIPGGEVPEEKVMEILKMMGAQIDRLERYTQKMNALQKLEDIVPERDETDFGELVGKCMETGALLSGELQTAYVTCVDGSVITNGNAYVKAGANASVSITKAMDVSMTNIRIDEALVLEVYENLLSNAVRYAKSRLEITIMLEDGKLMLSVEDDGEGFSKEALRQATKPFYRGERETWQNEKIHFGVGLYMSKIICEKCHGELLLENGRYGGKVTAWFGEALEEDADKKMGK